MSEVTEEKLSFDIQQIMEMIPHRYPFLLVDRITDNALCPLDQLRTVIKDKKLKVLNI